MLLKLDGTVPDFTADATGGEFSLAAKRGKTVVLYFYPKDDTPGCTTEGANFAAAYGQFAKANAIVAGVSRDTLQSHEKFKAKMQFPFELISDPDEKLCELFGVMKTKTMYGRQVRGVERTTFVIDSAGALRKEWRGVKVPNHVDQVLAYAQTLA